MRIDSPTNQRVKDVVRLRTRRHREGSGLFIIEGARELGEAIDHDVEIVEVFVDPLRAPAGEIADLPGASVTECTGRVFDKLSMRQNPDGVLAVARQFATGLDALTLSASPLVLVAEGVEKPGNVGTMLRTAAAAGCDALIAVDGGTDLFNPNVVRASMGALFRLPTAAASADETVAWLRHRSVRIVASSPNGSGPPWEVDLRSASAVVIGNEPDGLSATWLAAADDIVAIPMPGGGDSLNAAAAAAVMIFEAVRQRTTR